MTPLGKLLLRRIAINGPMTIADYMTECLLHPEHGYYTTREPFGVEGDFTTAPEISQMFGEMVGLCLAQAWVDQSKPAPFTLGELGPGRGTLMADILRVARAAPGFVEAAQVHLVEASPKLRARQKEALGGVDVTWVDHTGALPDAPLFLVANEFFDALPIRQFTRDEQGWCEHLVGVKDGALMRGLGATTPYEDLAHRLEDTAIGGVVETCAPARPIIAEIAQRIGDQGGAALIIDYGNWRSNGDTLQAVEAHNMVDPLARPGLSDLTAHVDFEALAQAATRAVPSVKTSKMTSQGVFLERLGITNRAQTLAQNLSGDALDDLVAAHRRLTHPEEMGSLFQVLGLTHASAPDLPGLDI